MLRKNLRAKNSIRVACAVALTLFLSTAAAALDFTIIESEPDAEVGLWVRELQSQFSFRGVSKLISPSGDVFTPNSPPDLGEWRLPINFNSLAEAFDFMEGTWQATVPHPLPSRPPIGTYEFNIGAISVDPINRGEPTVLAPVPGAKIKNGSPFSIGWDYLTSAAVPDRTRLLIIPHNDDVGGSLKVGPTRNPGNNSFSSSSSTDGVTSFSSTLVHAPGSELFHLLTLESSENVLPLDVELRVGSHISFDSHVMLGDTTGLGSSFYMPFVGLTYSRQTAPFIVTLTLPEPSSLGLVAAMACCGYLRRRRACV